VPLKKLPSANEPKKFKSRDPRFDERSGKFNEDLFKKSYSFLDEYQKEEIQTLKATVAKIKDPEEKEALEVKLRKLVSRHPARDSILYRFVDLHFPSNKAWPTRNERKSSRPRRENGERRNRRRSRRARNLTSSRNVSTSILSTQLDIH
jgi:hypothetical protein